MFLFRSHESAAAACWMLYTWEFQCKQAWLLPSSKREGADGGPNICLCLAAHPGFSTQSRFSPRATREHTRQPIQSLIQAVTSCGTRRLNEPLSVTHVVQPQFLCHLCRRHGVWQILLVSKNEECCFAHFVFIQHLGQLLTCILNTITVVAVDHVDEAICSLIIVPPERTNLVLATDVPHCETQVFVFYRLDIEADGWDGGDNFSQLQFVENGRLTSCIQSDHENAHLRLAHKSLP